jgi:hypothetical protein
VIRNFMSRFLSIKHATRICEAGLLAKDIFRP